MKYNLIPNMLFCFKMNIQGGAKVGLYTCVQAEYTKHSLFLHYSFLIIVLFSIRRIVNPLLPHPVHQRWNGKVHHGYVSSLLLGTNSKMTAVF